MDVSDVAVNTSDPPSEADYDSSEERWTSIFPQKVVKNFDNEEITSSLHVDVIIKTELETFEVCDVSFEK